MKIISLIRPYPIAIFIILYFTLCFAATGSQARPNDASETTVTGETDSLPLATIDMALLLAAHPEMVYYDSATGLFIKPFSVSERKMQIAEVCSSRRAQFKKAYEEKLPELKRLLDDINFAQDELKTINKRMAHELKPVLAKHEALIGAETDELAINELAYRKNKEIKGIEAKYAAESKACNDKLSSLIASYEKICSALLKIHFLTPEETAKKFETINHEIETAVQTAAKKRGVLTILNYSVLASDIRKSAETAQTSLEDKLKKIKTLETVMNNEPDYSKIFCSLNFFDEKLSRDPDPSFSNPDHLNYLKNLYLNNYVDFSANLLASKNKIKNVAAVNEFISQPVIFGGYDLTSDALKEILKLNAE